MSGNASSASVERGRRSTISRSETSSRIQPRGRLRSTARRSRQARERLRELLPLRVERGQALDLFPGFFGRDAQRVGIGERRELFFEPGDATLGGERF